MVFAHAGRAYAIVRQINRVPTGDDAKLVPNNGLSVFVEANFRPNASRRFATVNTDLIGGASVSHSFRATPELDHCVASL